MQLTTVEVDMEEMSKTAVTFIRGKLKNPHKKYGRTFIKGKNFIWQFGKETKVEKSWE